MADSYLLGYGVFSVGGTPVALTRGGGQFTVEREYKIVNADGDYGPVKGRVRKDMSVAKLTVNQLELIPENTVKMYPALTCTTVGSPAVHTITGKNDIEDSDYNIVTWTGQLNDGTEALITLKDAINLENIDWAMLDKDEVIPVLIYQAAYDPTDRTTEPWEIKFTEK